MSKLIISTTQGLYKAIEIEIDGKSYKVTARFTHKFLKKIGEYDKQIAQGDMDAPFKRLEMLIGKQPIIDKLDIREVKEITEHIIENLYKPEKNLTGKEKNGKRSGEKS